MITTSPHKIKIPQQGDIVCCSGLLLGPTCMLHIFSSVGVSIISRQNSANCGSSEITCTKSAYTSLKVSPAANRLTKSANRSPEYAVRQLNPPGSPEQGHQSNLHPTATGAIIPRSRRGQSKWCRALCQAMGTDL